jgi:NADH-quinone oxidoreductase subunit J
MLLNIHYLLLSHLIFSAVLVILAENPIHSIISLISAFCHASLTLFLFKVEFLGFCFLIVYVGAIAVLFLFVVMMLNIKTFTIKDIELFFYLSFWLVLFVSFFKDRVNAIFSSNDILLFENTNPILFDDLSNIDLFGQALYNYYISCTLCAGLLLLVALINSILLTMNFEEVFDQTAKQCARSDRTLSQFF